MKEFVAENKFNLLPNSLLDVKELRQAKDNKQLSKFGFEKSKPPIESDSEQQIT